MKYCRVTEEDTASHALAKGVPEAGYSGEAIKDNSTAYYCACLHHL